MTVSFIKEDSLPLIKESGKSIRRPRLHELSQWADADQPGAGIAVTRFNDFNGLLLRRH